MAYDVKAHYDHFTMRGMGYNTGGYRGRRAAGTLYFVLKLCHNSARSNSIDHQKLWRRHSRISHYIA